MKGNTDVHIPNDKYRDNYDSIFKKPKKPMLVCKYCSHDMDKCICDGCR